MKGKISNETFDEWNRETGRTTLPERVRTKLAAWMPRPEELRVFAFGQTLGGARAVTSLPVHIERTTATRIGAERDPAAVGRPRGLTAASGTAGQAGQRVALGVVDSCTADRVFGSTARGDAGPSSDVDLLVDVEPGRTLLDVIAFEQDLEEPLGDPLTS